MSAPHRCTRPPLSDKQVAAAAAAAHHLRDVNLTPVFDPPTLQALWRCRAPPACRRTARRRPMSDDIDRSDVVADLDADEARALSRPDPHRG